MIHGEIRNAWPTLILKLDAVARLTYVLPRPFLQEIMRWYQLEEDIKYWDIQYYFCEDFC